MKATIKLTEITKLDLGSLLAHLNVTLENEVHSDKTTFSMTSTGVSLRVVSEHSTEELSNLCKWLKLVSKDKSNFRDNDAELRIMAQEMIRMHKKLKKVNIL